jgi:hypothetical protein
MHKEEAAKMKKRQGMSQNLNLRRRFKMNVQNHHKIVRLTCLQKLQQRWTRHMDQKIRLVQSVASHWVDKNLF